LKLKALLCLTTATPFLLYTPSLSPGFLHSLPRSGSGSILELLLRLKLWLQLWLMLVFGLTLELKLTLWLKLKASATFLCPFRRPNCSPPPALGQRGSPPLAAGRFPPANSLPLALSQAEPFIREFFHNHLGAYNPFKNRKVLKSANPWPFLLINEISQATEPRRLH